MKKAIIGHKSRFRIFIGIVLIFSAVMIILGQFGANLYYGITWWRVLLGALLIAWLVDSIAEKQFIETVFPLAFLFMVFEPTIAHALGKEDLNLISNWIVFLAAVLLSIGLKALFPGKWKRGSKMISSQTVYLDGSDLSNAEITEVMGKVEAYITNKDSYDGNGTVTISENLGEVRFHIPSNWNAVVNVSENLGKVEVPEQEDGQFDKSIIVNVTENLGKVSIIFD